MQHWRAVIEYEAGATVSSMVTDRQRLPLFFSLSITIIITYHNRLTLMIAILSSLNTLYTVTSHFLAHHLSSIYTHISTIFIDDLLFPHILPYPIRSLHLLPQSVFSPIEPSHGLMVVCLILGTKFSNKKPPTPSWLRF